MNYSENCYLTILDFIKGGSLSSLYLFNRSVSDIVLAAGADRTIQVFDMNQGCMATQIPDAHCRAVHHLTQNKVRE